MSRDNFDAFSGMSSECVGNKRLDSFKFYEKYFKMREGCEVPKGNVTSREIPECFLRDKDIHTGCFKEA